MDAFEKVKKEVSSSPVLYTFDVNNAAYQVFADFSTNALETVLSLYNDKGERQPVECAKKWLKLKLDMLL